MINTKDAHAFAFAATSDDLGDSAWELIGFDRSLPAGAGVLPMRRLSPGVPRRAYALVQWDGKTSPQVVSVFADVDKAKAHLHVFQLVGEIVEHALTPEERAHLIHIADTAPTAEDAARVMSAYLQQLTGTKHFAQALVERAALATMPVTTVH